MKVRSLLLAVTLLPATATAQNIARDLVLDVKHGMVDMLVVWASPFHGDLRHYAIGAAGIGVAALSSIADDNVAAWVRENPNAGIIKAVEPFRDQSRLSLVHIGSGSWYPEGSLAIYGVGLLARNRAIRDFGMGCLVAGEAHGLVRGAVYQLVSRERPLFRETIDGVEVDRPGRPYHITTPGQSTWWDNSFFGGHVATMTSCVAFVTTRFHLGYAEPLLWAADLGLALGRMADQRHYTSDIVVGGLVGFGIGRLVGERSRARMEKHARADSAANREDGRADSRSWSDGLYLSSSGAATLVGWRTPR